MQATGKVKEVSGQYYFKCPGCHMIHSVGKSWEFNGDFGSPSFSPSILVTGIPGMRCHSYIKNGMIQFLDDCSHELKNQTIEVPDYENES